MPDTDVTVVEAAVDFPTVALRPPLVLSGGTIDRVTRPLVRVTVADRSGRTAEGVGTTVLSVPWSWPRSERSVDDRDATLRRLCERLAAAATGLPATDPIRLWRELSADLPPSDEVPRLAALLCLGAVDNAVHDGWAVAAGRPATEMYTADHLADDLGSLLGPSLAGRYPGDFLVPPRPVLPIQHLVGAGDPLPDLLDWWRADRFRAVKVKVLGHDPRADAERVGAVHEVVHGCAGAEVALAVDPNEAYDSPAAVDALMSELDSHWPEAARSVRYVEQPVPRGTPLGTHGHRVPVVMDEGSSGVDSLLSLREHGWDGVVIKAGKGQTLALLALSYACRHELFVTVQDLTATDLALAHSARLVSAFGTPHLEYNSRQYAPGANADLARTRPELVRVHDGTVRVGPPTAGIH